MASKQRLTFASNWALEVIGVKEIDEQLYHTLPHTDCVVDYDNIDDLLLVNSNATPQVVKILASYIEENRHKDLLEVPRVRQIDISVGVEPHENHLDQLEAQQGDLLALEDGSEGAVIPCPVEEVTEFWRSPGGSLGCFASQFLDILAGIASCTGTKISIINPVKGILVSGGNKSDVDDALVKLTRIEQSLSGINNPQSVGNLAIQAENCPLRIQNPVAPRRILTDPNLSSNLDHGQMFVAVELHYDPMKQSRHLPLNLADPPRSNGGRRASNIWKDFKFQEMGKGDEYIAMESIAEGEPTNPCTTLPNPYISPQKDDEIRKWREMTKPESMEQVPNSPPATEPEVPCASSPTPSTKPVPPFIKSRRAKPSGQIAQNKDILDTHAPIIRANQINTSDDDACEIPKSRNKYRMKVTYNAETGLSECNDIAEKDEDQPPCPNIADLNQVTSSSINDLVGLVWETEDHCPWVSTVPEILSVPNSSSSGSFSEQSKRLDGLKMMVVKYQVHSSPVSRRPSNSGSLPRQVFARQVLEAYEKSNKFDVLQQEGEICTREFHHTMSQKAGKGKANKAKFKAQRQATIEEAWGLPNKMSKERTTDLPQSSLSSNEKGIGNIIAPSHQIWKGSRTTQDPEEAGRGRLKELFESIITTLDAGECFPGPLTLEVQFGILLIPTMPKSWNDHLMTRDEWTKTFQPRGGIPAPTVNFINRITNSGSDVDYVLGLQTSLEAGKRRLFENNYSDYNVCYEFHCLTKTNRPLVIVVQEDGSYSFKKPSATLGAVNLHFPGQIWDARVTLSGNIEPMEDTTPELKDAVQYLVDHIWVQPGESLQIFTKTPKGNQISIVKVMLRRWTRHRHIRPDEVSLKVSSNQTNLESDQGSVGSSEEDRDILIQITEVQDLFIGKHPMDCQAARARNTTVKEMTKNGRMWYELSLVSPIIETVLETNATLEVGERTEDWRGVDLFGRDAAFLCEKSTEATEGSPSLSPIATEIGPAGLGDLLRLAKTVVEQIDSVGYYNSVPPVEITRVSAPPGSSWAPRPTGTYAHSAVEPKGLGVDELESIKEMGSAVIGHDKQNSSFFEQPASEMGYW